MTQALIVCGAQKTADSLHALLVPRFYPEADVVRSASRARREASVKAYRLALVNMPLPDEAGGALARDLGRSGATDVVLLADEGLAAGDFSDLFVLALQKPVSKALLENTLQVLCFAQQRDEKLREENKKLSAKLEESRLVGRAKCALIAYRQMTEEEAHHYIELLAMDSRVPKKEVARDILRMYE